MIRPPRQRTHFPPLWSLRPTRRASGRRRPPARGPRPTPQPRVRHRVGLVASAGARGPATIETKWSPWGTGGVGPLPRWSVPASGTARTARGNAPAAGSPRRPAAGAIRLVRRCKPFRLLAGLWNVARSPGAVRSSPVSGRRPAGPRRAARHPVTRAAGYLGPCGPGRGRWLERRPRHRRGYGAGVGTVPRPSARADRPGRRTPLRLGRWQTGPTVPNRCRARRDHRPGGGRGGGGCSEQHAPSTWSPAKSTLHLTAECQSTLPKKMLHSSDNNSITSRIVPPVWGETVPAIGSAVCPWGVNRNDVPSSLGPKCRRRQDFGPASRTSGVDWAGLGRGVGSVLVAGPARFFSHNSTSRGQLDPFPRLVYNSSTHLG